MAIATTIKIMKFRRKHLYFLILISLGTLVKSDDSCKKSYDFFTKEGRHYCNHNQSTTTCQSDIPELLIHEPNKEDGTADVEFDFDPNCIYNLTVIYVQESEENCKYNSNNDEERAHSAYRYEGRYLSSDDINPTTEYCSKKGIIKLKHLTSGCYKLQITNNNVKLNNDQYEGKYKTFNVNPKKINFTDFDPAHNYIIQYIHDDDLSLNSSKVNATLTVIHPFFLLHPTVMLQIFSVKNSMISETKFDQNIIPLVTNGNKMTKYSTCNSTKNDIEISCHVQDADELFTCDIKGLNPGIYIFKYTLNNIIQCYYCMGCTYWDDCFVSSLPRDTEKERKIPKPVTLSSQSSANTSESFFPWIIMIVILCLLVVIFIFVIYYRKCIWARGGNIYKNNFGKCKKPPSDSSLSSKQDHSLLIENEEELLLLYPRDAEEVMSTMEALRNALTAEGFKVFDIFDEDQEKEINKGPHTWISDILDKNKTKVIIVRTYCGKILLAEDSSDAYIKADYRDNLFVFAMSRLRECYNSHDIFTVDVGMNTYYPHELNRGAIYNLPENVSKFLQNLKNSSNCTSNVENNNIWNEFTTSAELMQAFVENEKYLKDLLQVDFEENKKISEDFDTDIKKDDQVVLEICPRV